MARVIKKNLFLILGVLLTVACLFLLGNTFVSLAADEPEDASFYKLASAASAHMNDRLGHNEGIVMPNSSNHANEDGSITGEISFGNAGGLLGYCDEADTDGLIAGWINSALSSSSATFSYNSLQKLPTSSGGHTSALYAYCRYGYLLNYLGLDSTATETSFDFFRFLAGFLMTAAYIMAFTVDVVFSAAVNILQTLNPFRLFVSGFGPVWNNYVDGLAADSPLYGLSVFLGNVYNTLSTLSWAALIPISFVFLVFSFLVLKSSNRMAKLKKYLIRIVFLTAGIPLLGSLYTMSLDQLGDPGNGGMGAATRIVQSTFCDFENWAKNCRLGVSGEGGTSFLMSANDGADVGKAHPSAEAMLRNICYAINIEAHTGRKDTTALGDGLSATDGSEFTLGNDSSTISDIITTVGMLGRYMQGSFFYASDWETLVKAKLTTNSSGDSDYYDTVMDMFGKSDKASDFKDTNHFDGSSGWGSVDMWANGNMEAGHNVAIGLLPNGAGSAVRYKVNGSASPPGTHGEAADPSVKYGLSTMAMYNYLTSKFTKSSVVVYSNERASSGFIRESHRSVNMIGTGIISVMYFFNALVMLVAMIIVGWCYGFGIIFGNLKRTIRFITSVPFAMLGSIRGIAKVLTYAIVMILEIVGTLFVYNLIVEVLLGISSIIEQPIMHALGGSALAGGAGVLGLVNLMMGPMGYAITVVMLIITCVVLILFVIMAIRLRKVIIKSLDESAAAIINKFMDVDETYKGINEPSKPGMLQKAAGSVAQGAGMAAGSKLVGAAGSAIGSKFGTGAASAGTSKPTSSSGAGEAVAGGSSEGAAAKAAMAAAGSAGGASGGGFGGGSEANEGAGFGSGDTSDMEDRQMAAPVLGMPMASSAGGSVLDAVSEAGDDAEEKAQATMDSMTGKTDAMEEEANDEAKSEIAKEERKEGAKKLAGGAVDAAIGGAKVAAAASTGDVKMGVEGAQQLAKGADNMSKGSGQMKNAGKKAEKEVNQAQAEKNRQKGAVAASSSTPPPRGSSTHGSTSSSKSEKSSVQAGAQAAGAVKGAAGKDGAAGKAVGSTQTRQPKAATAGSAGARPRTAAQGSKSGGQKSGQAGSGSARTVKAAGAGSTSVRQGNTSQTNVTNNRGGAVSESSHVNMKNQQSNRSSQSNNQSYKASNIKNGTQKKGAGQSGSGVKSAKAVQAQKQQGTRSFQQSQAQTAEKSRQSSMAKQTQGRNEVQAGSYRMNQANMSQSQAAPSSRTAGGSSQSSIEKEAVKPVVQKKLDTSSLDDDI